MATVPAIPHPLSPSPNGYGPSLNKTSRKKIIRRPPGSHRCVRRPVGPTNTAQTPIPSCLHQARYIVLGCGSFVRGRKRKKVDSRPFLYSRGGVRSIREKPVETSHYISINDSVSQSYIYQTPLVHDSPVSRTEYPKQVGSHRWRENAISQVEIVPQLVLQFCA